jgi:DNA-binding CsgD family transcriptional regulator
MLTRALLTVGPDFPDQTVTELLRQIFHAEFAGAGHVDLLGTNSRRWADSPSPLPASSAEFHHYAARHPLARAYQRIGESIPLRLSDVVSARAAPPAFAGTAMSYVLTIPLAVSARHVCTIALMRAGQDFSAREVKLAGELQPALSALYVLGDRLSGNPPGPLGPALTTRESAVLTCMADGLIMSAIARRLEISPGTVGKHIEHLYRKLDTHDRASTLLRAQALGILTAGRARD